jgi:serine/threonine protein kinase
MSINSAKTCPQCGAALREDAAEGLCPRCVMALNLKTETVVTGEPAAASAPRTPEELAPHFPQLEIIECLGRGGMGVVYKARQPQLDRVVALKILAPERVTEARFADRFLREARALAKLNHPNIVTIHDFGQTGGYFYLVMEFVDGVNLRELLRGGRLPPAEALAIVPAICDALQYAHDRGIVHRDIKPENILIDKEGKVKIADFGIAKMIEPQAGRADLPVSPDIGAARQHGPTGVVGTPKYMAPEQAEKPEEVDHRADIYSLGVVFYEMLTGELPGKLLEAPSKKVQIDVRLDEVVLRALERKPELRYQQAGDVKTMVETIAQTGEVGGGMAGAQKEEYGEKAPADPVPISEETRSKRERYLALSPFLSPESKEIALHMTDAEWKTMMRWGWFFGIWNAAICFSPVFILFFAPSTWHDWRVALAVIAVGVTAYPIWFKLLWHILCDTEWARAHGIKPIPILKYFSKASFARFPKRRPIPQRIPLLILLASLVAVPLMLFLAAQTLIWHVTHKYSKPEKAAQPALLRATLRILDMPAEMDTQSILRPAALFDRGDVRVIAAPYVLVRSGQEGEINIPPDAAITNSVLPILGGTVKTLIVRPHLDGGWVSYDLQAIVDSPRARATRQPLRHNSIRLGEFDEMEENGVKGRNYLAVMSIEMEPQLSAPFLGHFSNGTVELLLMAADPASNAVCWQADGFPSNERFPNSGGHVWSEGMDVRAIAFCVHGPSGQPILKFNREVGSPTFASMGFPDPKPLDAIFTEQFTCPSNLPKMDVQIGLPSGPWENLIGVGPHGGTSENAGRDGMWDIVVQTTGSGGDEVAVSCQYSVKEDWETRFVAVENNGDAIALRPKSQTGISTNLTSVMASMSRDEFDKVTGFELQRRKRQWVEFRNVSLEPGYHTKVEILDATPPKP